MSAHKTIQGSETETRELLVGTKEKDDLPIEGSLIYLSSKSIIFHKKSKQKKWELVARPGGTRSTRGFFRRCVSSSVGTC